MLIRKSGDFQENTTGYILAFSKDFIVLQETNNFRIDGYLIIPVKTIKSIRRNKFEKTIQKIHHKEGLYSRVGIKHKIDLTSWNSVCKSIKKTKLCVISECENPKQEYFCIGNIKRVNKKSLSIQYFDGTGKLDSFNTKHYFKEITKLAFDDIYANTFTKYTK